MLLWGQWPALRQSCEDSGLAPSTGHCYSRTGLGLWKGHLGGGGEGQLRMSFGVRHLGLPLTGCDLERVSSTSLTASSAKMGLLPFPLFLGLESVNLCGVDGRVPGTS